MNQEFTIGALKLIEDEEGFGVAQATKDGFEVIATFKFGLDAIKYFTEYAMVLAELETNKETNTIIQNIVHDDKRPNEEESDVNF